MSTLGNGIVTISDIYSNFNIKFHGDNNYCPTYRTLMTDKRLKIDGTYQQNQLVVINNISKNTQYLVLWVADWAEWAKSSGAEGRNDGKWVFKFNNKILDFCEDERFPESHLCYFDAEPVKTSDDVIIGTIEQWNSLYAHIDGEWDNVKLHGYDNGMDIDLVENLDFDTLRTTINMMILRNEDAYTNFMLTENNSGSGQAPSITKKTTIPIYWIEFETGDANEIDTYMTCSIESFGQQTHSSQFHVVGGYNNGGEINTLHYLGDIDLFYKTNQLFTNNVFIKFSFNDNSTTSQNTICVEERVSGKWQKISSVYTWGDDVFGSDSSAFVKQKLQVFDAAARDLTYAIRVRFN